eukprot:1138116-Pelagomonas_calceolata.AAC.3
MFPTCTKKLETHHMEPSLETRRLAAGCLASWAEANDANRGKLMGLGLAGSHHEILPVRTREHISCGERPPGDVCNGRGHVVHPGHGRWVHSHLCCSQLTWPMGLYMAAQFPGSKPIALRQGRACVPVAGGRNS